MARPRARSRGTPRLRRSGCRGSRGPRARSRAQWCSRHHSLASPLVGHRAPRLAVAPPDRGRLLRRGSPPASDSGRRRSACSASTPTRWARTATAKSPLPRRGPPRPPRSRARSSGWGSFRATRSSDVRAAATTAVDRRHAGFRPTERALRTSFVVSMRAGRAAGMPSVTLRAPSRSS